MRLAPCSIALLLLGCSVAHGAPRDVLADCAARLPTHEQGLKQIEDDCPGLAEALQQLGVDALITPDSAARLRVRSLMELSAPVNRVSPTGARVPESGSLASIVRGLAVPPERAGWWSRLRDWLQHWLSGGERGASPAWLSGWLSALRNGGLLKALTYVLLGIVVLSAGRIIYRELRLAGVFSRNRSEVKGASNFDGPIAAAPLTLAQVRAVPSSERAPMLFRLLVQRLVATGRLPDDRSLTHRELTRRVALDDERQRAEWRHLSALAEKQVFAPSLVSEASLPPALADGEALYDSLLPAVKRF